MDKNLLGLALLQQNGYVDVPVILPINVAVNAGTVTYPFDLPPSRNISHILLEIGGGLTPAFISQIRVKPNGNPLQTFSFQRMDLMNQFFQQAVSGPDANNVYRLDISQIRQLLFGGSSFINFDTKDFVSGSAGDLREATTLNCGGKGNGNITIDELGLEVDVTGYNGANTAFIKVLLEAGPSYDGGAGLLKRLDFNTVVIGAGTVTLVKNAGLLFGDRQHTILDTLFLFPPSDGNGVFATFTNFRMWFNSNQVRQRDAAENATLQQLATVRAPQANMYAIDFTETGLGDKSLPIGDPKTDLYLQFDASQNGGAPLPGTLVIQQLGAGYL